MSQYIELLNRMKQEESHNLKISNDIMELINNINNGIYTDNNLIENKIINLNEIIKNDEYNQIIEEIKKIINDDNKIKHIKNLDYDEILHYCLLLQNNEYDNAEEFLSEVL
jgi:hypothetical protein